MSANAFELAANAQAAASNADNRLRSSSNCHLDLRRRRGPRPRQLDSGHLGCSLVSGITRGFEHGPVALHGRGGAALVRGNMTVLARGRGRSFSGALTAASISTAGNATTGALIATSVSSTLAHSRPRR